MDETEALRLLRRRVGVAGVVSLGGGVVLAFIWIVQSMEYGLNDTNPYVPPPSPLLPALAEFLAIAGVIAALAGLAIRRSRLRLLTFVGLGFAAGVAISMWRFDWDYRRVESAFEMIAAVPGSGRGHRREGSLYSREQGGGGDLGERVGISFRREYSPAPGSTPVAVASHYRDALSGWHCTGPSGRLYVLCDRADTRVEIYASEVGVGYTVKMTECLGGHRLGIYRGVDGWITDIPGGLPCGARSSG